MMVETFIGLGGNLGAPEQALVGAVKELIVDKASSAWKISALYLSAPIDSSGPDYVNAVLKLRTKLDAQTLLRRLLKIENDFGRIRPLGVHNAPRTLDLDLLLYGNLQIKTKDLIVPHPRMHERAFVLKPLVEIAPNIVIPGIGLAKEKLTEVDFQKIEKIKSPEQWFGNIGEKDAE